mmetsp:Transcript_87023/g.130488  ORF Transcript_87023/g.130488 Transcript_87023/m.130488 type:complete len:615 (-) Transcript_87023:44-1888(-)|eukprot:CAMPEP_0117005426 /NCGR_PEP_ID=MMETSP0472-20121206/6049_1 /TAXON_ID=693140 ORGANISM="Tiarina fusus, Strain LIS" /NCGR_SAMPLE_ID=MMETSP0472 /ASSEMBLY_ACC=CAM_ASM_000603 /LENGTH=614 /DNA_ID=CAMNT_0004706669 /DNA_START=147 /DNA_END=1991 /DNA_ORIENTATION=-
MPTKRPAAKRKRGFDQNEESSYDELIDAAAKVTRFRGWLDEGSSSPDGRMQHESFSLKIGGETLEVALGDSVLMRSASEESSFGDMDDSFDYYGSANKSDDRYVIARVERIWEEESDPESPGGKLQFLARWFLQKGEVESLRGTFSGVDSAEDFIARLTDKDLVLGNQTDPNPLTSICGAVQVVYRKPDADHELPTMPSNTYVCRYTTRIGEEAGHVDVIAFAGENDEWSDFLVGEDDPGFEGPTAGEVTNERSNDNSVASGSLSSSDVESEPPRAAGVSGPDEGSTEKRNIRVGPGHQAIVPSYLPNQISVSRNPIPVWKPGKISDTDMDDFLSKAAAILSPYLRSQKLTHTEPYSPLQCDRMEALYHSLDGAIKPTLSTVCTASELSSGPRADMLRECDSDAILAILNKMNYDTTAALAAIETNPRDFLTVWSIQEKELFNSGFRRYSGSLRMIYKGIAPSKDFKQVIDYHYRFKIPDQFRIFQDKKREQAVRMMECIETRRNISAGIQNSSFLNSVAEPSAKKRVVGSEWSKTSISDVAGAIEERRIKAKKLLLDVEKHMGEEKLHQIVTVIKRFNQRSTTANLKAMIVNICSGHPEFEQRLLEFFPKRLS